MTSLRDTQEKFQTYILLRDPVIQNQISGLDPEFIQTRLDVYREGYALRLLEVLGKAFPGLRALAGEEMFERLAREYLNEYPSSQFSVGNFGRYFSKFLASHIPSEPQFAEMAAFEWALDETLTAPDGPSLTFEDMANIPPESWSQLCLIPHPSLQLLSLFYSNLPFVWQTINPTNCTKKCEHEGDHEAQSDQLQKETEPTTWAIWRFNLQSYYVDLSKEQLWMFQALRSGKSFAEVCEGLCEWLSEEEVTQFAAENLRNWIVEGMFSKACF